MSVTDILKEYINSNNILIIIFASTQFNKNQNLLLIVKNGSDLLLTRELFV